MALRAARATCRRSARAWRRATSQASEVRLNVRRPLDDRNAGAGAGAPRPRRVVYAIDVLESLDKRNLVTPLLLYHESPKVRRRALSALGAVRSDIAQQWIPHIRRMLGDGDAGVRAAAIGALAAISQEDAASLARPLLADPDPRIRATAAVALAGSSRPADVDQAEAALLDLAGDTEDRPRRRAATWRSRIRQIADPRFRRLLMPLLYDPAPEVADEAMESVQAAEPKRRRLHVRADAGVAAAQPAAQGPRPRRAGRLRRTGRRRARALPARSGRGHLGAPPHPGHARPDPVAEVGRRAGRRRSRSGTASCATRSCRRSSGCAANMPS